MRPDPEYIRTILSYRPETGGFTWRVSNSNRVKVGDAAGGINEYGYRVLGINGSLYMASHVAWVYMTGVWPVEVDHRDTDQLNDAWGNLREATRSQNQANRHKQRNNTSGFKGVCFHPQTGKWRARIMWAGKATSLGLHATREAAHAAYCAAAPHVHGEFARI